MDTDWLHRKDEKKLDNALYLFNLIVLYDPFLAMHCCNTAKIAAELAVSLNISGQKLIDISLAAQLHDIGKIKIPKILLNKQSPLSATESKVLEKHPIHSFTIINSFPQFKNIAEITLYHHEKYTGGGYPKGVKKQEIPFESCLIGLASAYEVMTSQQRSRRLLSPDLALQQLSKEKGISFDPDLVDCLITLKTRSVPLTRLKEELL